MPTAREKRCFIAEVGAASQNIWSYIMELVKIQLNKIKPYDKNPRKNDGAVEAVMENVKRRQRAQMKRSEMIG